MTEEQRTLLAKLKEGDQVMVWSAKEAGWIRAYFARPGEKRGIYVYKDGKTRWSSHGEVESFIDWKMPQVKDLVLTANPVLTGGT